MGSSQVGSLYTSLTLEDASFISNMKRAVTAAERGSAAIDRAFGIAAGAAEGFVGAISVDALVGVTKRALDYASSIGETAQQLGVSTRALQVYGYAATQVGVEQSSLETGLAKLTKTLGEAKMGGKAQVAAFNAVGISFAEVQRLSPDEAFRRVAEGLGKIPDPARRAAMETDLFGKTGQKLDTLLAGGVAQIDELTRAADDLGIVLSDKQIQNADATAGKIAELQKALGTKIAIVVADNAKAIEDMATAAFKLINVIAKGGSNVLNWFAGLAQVAKQAEGKGLLGVAMKFQAIVDPVGTAEFGERSRNFADIMSNTNYAANGLAGFDAPPVSKAGGAGTRGAGRNSVVAKAVESNASLRMGGNSEPSLFPAEKNVLVPIEPGLVNSPLKQMPALLASIASEYQLIKETAIDLSKVEIVSPKQVEAANRFAGNLSQNLAQSFFYSQSLGGALINSIKGAAAELAASKLLELLTGGAGGGIIGSIFGAIGSIFGGGRATGGSVSAGKAYLVGERGPEILTGASGRIIPNEMMKASNDNSMGRQRVDVSVDVRPSPLFQVAVATATQAVAADAAQSTLRSAVRPRLPASRGA